VNGELKQLIEEAVKDENGRLKIRIIEKPGPKLVYVLKGITASSNELCHRPEKCLMCLSGNTGVCHKSYILYKIECQAEDCKCVYIGESNRNGLSRGSEHLSDSQSKTVEGIEDSVIARHYWEKHDGMEQGVKMKLIKTFRGDPTGRPSCFSQ
jgi:hypothetical protein